ncbi:ankyrin repeat domain-containing protein [Caballeronia sp. AZ7_KS35]|uniref:ankyrin repeat domain-containing protein n=1 Tax=Caballeronia sp. AZ7_KS35 TaxID=2921762 RepID=UPI0020284891|nr:ankyrin repeat domain-containing protein [Caballeronia sp. AZ7_KS35]
MSEDLIGNLSQKVNRFFIGDKGATGTAGVISGWYMSTHLKDMMRNGQYDQLSTLLDFKDPKDRDSALRLAVISEQSPKCIEYLLKKGANPLAEDAYPTVFGPNRFKPSSGS